MVKKLFLTVALMMAASVVRAEYSFSTDATGLIYRMTTLKAESGPSGKLSLAPGYVIPTTEQLTSGITSYETDPCFLAYKTAHPYNDANWNNAVSRLDANQIIWNNAASRLDANQVNWNSAVSTLANKYVLAPTTGDPCTETLSSLPVVIYGHETKVLGDPCGFMDVNVGGAIRHVPWY